MPSRTAPNLIKRRFIRENGAPGGTRTPDLLVRSQTLYPAELRAHRETQFSIGAKSPPTRRATRMRRASERKAIANWSRLIAAPSGFSLRSVPPNDIWAAPFPKLV